MTPNKKEVSFYYIDDTSFFDSSKKIANIFSNSTRHLNPSHVFWLLFVYVL